MKVARGEMEMPIDGQLPSRGACSYCSQPVLFTDRRKKGKEPGSYVHTSCLETEQNAWFTSSSAAASYPQSPSSPSAQPDSQADKEVIAMADMTVHAVNGIRVALELGRSLSRVRPRHR